MINYRQEVDLVHHPLCSFCEREAVQIIVNHWDIWFEEGTSVTRLCQTHKEKLKKLGVKETNLVLRGKANLL